LHDWENAAEAKCSTVHASSAALTANPKIRVVLVVPAFPKLSETFIVSKFVGLLERDWDVQVVCHKSEESQWKSFPNLQTRKDARSRVHLDWPHRPRWLAAVGLPVVLLWCLRYNAAGTWRYLRCGFRRFGLDVFRRLYLDAVLVALKPDLLHFEFGALAAERMYLKELLECKVVVSFRGYDLNRSGLEQSDYFREVWEHADSLHLLGKGLWKRAQHRGCPSGKARALIPPAIDTKVFGPERSKRASSAPGRPLQILSVGRLTWEKGYEYSMQAIKLLAKMGIRSQFRVVGDGPMLEALAFARQQEGLEDSAQFLGPLTREDVREEMLNADVFLHGAVSEGFGNAVLEAQAMSLPVVCTDAGGLPENVQDGETGFVVPRRDSEQLAEKLAVLARDPERRQRMGQAGCRRVQAHFGLEDQITAFEKLYRSVIAGTEDGNQRSMNLGS